MRTNKFLIMSSFALLVSAPMFADIVLTGNSSQNGFITMPTPTAVGNLGADVSNPNQSPAPYWDHPSQDATPGTNAACDIGYIVNKTYTGAGCSNANGNPLGPDDPVATSYWGNTTSANGGNYDPAFAFENLNGANTVEFEISLTGFGSNDQFGYFDFSNTGVEQDHLLFNSSSATDTAYVTIPANDLFGFYLISGNGTTYKTFSYTGTYGTSSFVLQNQIQHFALFATDNAGCTPGGRTCGANSSTDNFYIGVEDNGASGLADNTIGTKSDFDYNDIVAHISTVPEPGSLPIMVTGLAGMALVLRRRFQAKK